MKLIPLTRGCRAMVDDTDYEWLSQWKWCCLRRPRGTDYAIRAQYPSGGGRIQIYMHRALLGAEPGEEVDHVDGNGLNNTRENLRLCTRVQNSQNTAKRNIDASSHYKGVSWSPRMGKWQCDITADGTSHHLGFFCSEHEAAVAYNEAAERLHNEFALLNDVSGIDDRKALDRREYAADIRDQVIVGLKNSGIAQKEIARQLGVHEAAVSLWVHGKRVPAWPTVRLIADTFPNLVPPDCIAVLRGDLHASTTTINVVAPTGAQGAREGANKGNRPQRTKDGPTAPNPGPVESHRGGER